MEISRDSHEDRDSDDGESDVDESNEEASGAAAQQVYDLSDAPHGQLERLKTQLDGMMKNRTRILWQKKADINSSFHLEPP